MKKYSYLIVLSAFVMLLPMTITDEIPCYAAMVVEALSVGAIDPLFCFALGLYASRDIRRLWGFPVVAAGVFLIGYALFFDGNESYVSYAVAFAGIGEATMLLRVGWDRLTRAIAEYRKK